jgi:hypothetical protein
VGRLSRAFLGSWSADRPFKRGRADGYESDLGSLVNQGTLAAQNGGFLYVHINSWSSSGTLAAHSNGELALVSSGSNSGPVTADTGGVVYLDGSWRFISRRASCLLCEMK